MSTKTNMSLRTKKILAGIGIVFGTIVVFLVSFALSFSLIVNPINLFTFGDSDAVKENEELKKEVQTLTDEVELLNVTVDKYKASAAAVQTVMTPETTPAESTPQVNQAEQTAEPEVQETTEEDTLTESEKEFSPETVVGTDAETPEDVEEPITIIDISE